MKRSILIAAAALLCALSFFLAELKEVGARHGIVVDDPVSSLDHARMEAVAKRLVKEATVGRQVHHKVLRNYYDNWVEKVAEHCRNRET